MDDFDPYEYDTAVTYAAKTGDSSRGVTLEQALPQNDPEVDEFAGEGSRSSASLTDLVVPLIVAVTFILIAALSF